MCGARFQGTNCHNVGARPCLLNLIPPFRPPLALAADSVLVPTAGQEPSGLNKVCNSEVLLHGGKECGPAASIEDEEYRSPAVASTDDMLG